MGRLPTLRTSAVLRWRAAAVASVRNCESIANLKSALKFARKCQAQSSPTMSLGGVSQEIYEC